MKDQLTLLAETDWDVLVVLDACRADAFKTVTRMGEAVRSPGTDTPSWLRAAAPVLAGRGVTYVSANPVVEREVAKRKLDLPTLSLWERHCGYFTRLDIPSVHPMSVTSAVLELPELACRRLIVHYLQPHSPYIGEPPLKKARWGRGEGRLFATCHRLGRPDHAVRDREITWGELRTAYLANLCLAWEAVRILAAGLEGRRVFLTADHGEMLGERGERFGHEPGWDFPELRAVPWLDLENCGGERMSTEDKLEALGYI